MSRLSITSLLLALVLMLTSGYIPAQAGTTVHTNGAGILRPATNQQMLSINLSPSAEVPTIVGRWVITICWLSNSRCRDQIQTFYPNGTLSSSSSTDNLTGRWTQTGTMVEWIYDTTTVNSFQYAGTITGTEMVGSAYSPSGARRATWSAGRVDRPPLPPPSDPFGPLSIVGQWAVARCSTDTRDCSADQTYTFQANGIF